MVEAVEASTAVGAVVSTAAEDLAAGDTMAAGTAAIVADPMAAIVAVAGTAAMGLRDRVVPSVGCEAVPRRCAVRPRQDPGHSIEARASVTARRDGIRFRVEGEREPCLHDPARPEWQAGPVWLE